MRKLSFVMMLLYAIMLHGLPESFRMRSLGGTIRDDADMVIDPIELRYVQGIRLFTNLSNTLEEPQPFFGEGTQGEFLAGAAFENLWLARLRHCLLWNFSDRKTPLPFVYTDLSGGAVEHRGKIDFSDGLLSDTDDDGIADFFTSRQGSMEAWDESHAERMILNNSMIWGDRVIGMRIVYQSAGFNNNTASRGFTLAGIDPGEASYSDHLLQYAHNADSLSTLLEDTFETGDFDSGEDTSGLGIHLAWQMPWKRRELRFLLNVDMPDMKKHDNQSWGLSGVNSQTNVTRSQAEKYITENDLSRMDFTLGGSVRETFFESEERRNDGFWETGLHFVYGMGDYSERTRNETLDHSFISGDSLSAGEQKRSTINTSWSSGDAGLMGMSFWGRYQRPLGDRMLLGLHLGWEYRSLEVDSGWNAQYLHTESNIDGAFDAVEDIRITDSERMTGSHTIEETRSSFVTGAGIEYACTGSRQWLLRFGSQFKLERMDMNNEFSAKTAQPLTRRLETGDGGSVTQTLDGSCIDVISTSEETILSQAEYSFGVGYVPAPQMRIDIMGLFGDRDVDFINTQFSSLMLSFTLRL